MEYAFICHYSDDIVNRKVQRK